MTAPVPAETTGRSGPRGPGRRPARPAGQPRAVHVARRGQCTGRRHGRPGTDRRTAAGDRGLRAPGLHRRIDLHRRLRSDQGGHQSRGRCALRPARSEAGPRRRLAHRAAGPGHAHLGAGVGLGRAGQRPPRRQPGADLVDHRDHEDRPRRATATRSCHGPQRGRGLRRARPDRPAHRAPGRALRAAAGAFPLGVAYAGLGLGLSAVFVRETQGHARHEAASHLDP